MNSRQDIRKFMESLTEQAGETSSDRAQDIYQIVQSELAAAEEDGLDPNEVLSELLIELKTDI